MIHYFLYGRESKIHPVPKGHQISVILILREPVRSGTSKEEIEVVDSIEETGPIPATMH